MNIIFDLDGTLLDTLGGLAASHNRILQRAGYPTHPVDAYRMFIGDGLQKCIERMLPAEVSDASIVKALMRAHNKDYAAHWQQGVSAYPGINQLVADLKLRGCTLCVLSNKPHNFSCQFVEHFFEGQFDVVMGHRDGTPHKPDPTSTLEMLDTLGVDAPDCLFVGDTATDMACPRRFKF